MRSPAGHARRAAAAPLAAPLALAFLLALLPLPLNALAAHAGGPGSGVEGGMGAAVVIMVEGGSRLAAPALGVLLLLGSAPTAHRRTSLRPTRGAEPRALVVPRRTLLVELGRLRLEGG